MSVRCSHCHRFGPWPSHRLRGVGERFLCPACVIIPLIAELIVAPRPEWLTRGVAKDFIARSMA